MPRYVTKSANPAADEIPLGKGNSHAQPLDALSTELGLPPGTMNALEAHGKGPPVFKVGRRKFCRVADFYEWLDNIATGRIDATLIDHKKRRPVPPPDPPPPPPEAAGSKRQPRDVAGGRSKRGEDRTGAS